MLCIRMLPGWRLLQWWSLLLPAMLIAVLTPELEGSIQLKRGVKCRESNITLDQRIQRAEVIFYGFVTRVYRKRHVSRGSRVSHHSLSSRSSLYTGELFIVNVFKGAQVLADLLDTRPGLGGVYNLRDKRINVTGFGSVSWCRSPVQEQHTYIVLAREVGGGLRAQYDMPSGAVLPWTKANEDHVWSALGWESWSEWSGCSATCGGGHQHRGRYCLRPQPCHGYNTERRRCNLFPSSGSQDLLHLEEARHRPSKFGWRKSPGGRVGSWRAVKNKPFLLHVHDLYPKGMPKDFSMIMTVRPNVNNNGLLFLLHRAHAGDVYLGLGLGNALEVIHTQPGATEGDLLPVTVSPINVNLTDGRWHHVSLGISSDSIVQVYVDCRWVSRQMLSRNPFHVPNDTLLYIGGMPGRSYEGEMSQFTISQTSDAAMGQCRAEPIPLMDHTMQFQGRPLSELHTGVNEDNNKESNEIKRDYDNNNKDYFDYDTYKDVYDPAVIYDNAYDLDWVDPDGEHEESDKEKREDTSWFTVITEPPKVQRPPTAHAQIWDDEDFAEDIDTEGSGASLIDSSRSFAMGWTTWSGCSVSCGRGMRVRSYQCLPGPDQRTCLLANLERHETKPCVIKNCGVPLVSKIPTTTAPGPSTFISKPRDQYITTPSFQVDDGNQFINDYGRNGSTTPTPLVLLHNTTITPPNSNMSLEVYISPPKVPIDDEGKQLINSNQTQFVFYPYDKNGRRRINEVLSPITDPNPRSWNYKWEYRHHYNHQYPNAGSHNQYQSYYNSKNSMASCTGLCLNEGICEMNGICQCSSSWNGRHCEVPVCGQGCTNGGVCVQPGVCSCPQGYSGPYCQHAVCNPPCSNGGSCVLPGLCLCPPGFLPPTCSPICQRMCLHGGTCLGDRCLCPEGYQGGNCQNPICDPPCQNRGRCMAPGVCSCQPGYIGRHCQQAVCRPGCHNGGTCYAPYKCSCPQGTFGSYCQNFWCSSGCGVGGRCVGVELCQCGPGYTGARCETPICDPPCANGGSCFSPGVCACPKDYTGNLCNIKVLRKCQYVPKQVAYTRTYKKLVPQHYTHSCGSWGWNTCSSVRHVYQTHTQTHYTTVYTCQQPRS